MAELTEELRVLVTAEVVRAIKDLQKLDTGTKSVTTSFNALGKSISAAFVIKEIIAFEKASSANDSSVSPTITFCASTNH